MRGVMARLSLLAILIAGMIGLSVVPAQAITGGSTVSASQYPYTAEVIVKTGTFSTSYCTGTLIGPRWVITAAHCVVNFQTGDRYAPSAFKVSVGNEKSNWNSTAIAVNRVERHPNYPSHLGDAQAWPADVALLQLVHDAGKPSLALAAGEAAPGTDITYLGWGCQAVSLAECGTPSSTLQLRSSTVKRDDTECKFTGAYVAFNFCTSRPGPVSTVRHGDSGGPVLKATPTGDRLVGVTSGSNPGYDISSSVPYVLGWIHQVTGIGAPTESSAPPVSPASNVPQAYTYTVYHTGGIGLNVRPGPSSASGTPLYKLGEGAQVTIDCQVHGQRVLAETDIWDHVVSGGWVYDEYVSTPNIGTFSIRQC